MNSRIAVFGLFALIGVGFVGCELLQSGAPAVTPAMTRVASEDGISATTLETGRRLLATRCTGCHGLEPISKYSPAEWRGHVREMADRSGLDHIEEEQIQADLVSARRTLDLDPGPPSL